MWAEEGAGESVTGINMIAMQGAHTEFSEEEKLIVAELTLILSEKL